MISAWARRTFSSLDNPHYRLLWIGTTMSFLAFGMSMIVQGIVAFEITGKNGDVGTVALGMGIATILTAPFGGVLADRVSKRILLLVGQGLICANFALVGVAILTDTITIAWLFLSTFVMGLTFSFIAPARQAWIGELLTGPKLTNGIALQQVGMTATRVLGPWLAVALIAFPGVGTGGTYMVMGVLIFFVVLTLGRMPASRPRTGPRSSALADMRLGISHVVSRPRLALLAASFILVVMLGFSYQVILPGYLNNELNRSTRDMGWLLGVSGAAGLVVTVAVSSVAGGKHAWRMLIASAVVLGVGLMLLALAPGFIAALVVMGIIGVGSSIFQMLNSSLILQESDPAYYGRVMALTMLAWGMNSLVGLPFGFLADSVGERPVLMVMGAGVIGIAVLTAVAQPLTARKRVIPASAVSQPVAGGG